MVNPQFIEEQHVAISDVKELLEMIEKRDGELNFRTNKVKDYLTTVDTMLTMDQKEKLAKKLGELGVTRLKPEHTIKIVDFLPTTPNDLKVVLQAYPLSLAKKDQELIVTTVKEFLS